MVRVAGVTSWMSIPLPPLPPQRPWEGLRGGEDSWLELWVQELHGHVVAGLKSLPSNRKGHWGHRGSN